MHLLEAVPRGSGADRNEIFQVKQTAPALPVCLLSANDAMTLSLRYFYWLIMISRPRFYWHEFQLKNSTISRFIFSTESLPV